MADYGILNPAVEALRADPTSRLSQLPLDVCVQQISSRFKKQPARCATATNFEWTVDDSKYIQLPEGYEPSDTAVDALNNVLLRSVSVDETPEATAATGDTFDYTYNEMCPQLGRRLMIGTRKVRPCTADRAANCCRCSPAGHEQPIVEHDCSKCCGLCTGVTSTEHWKLVRVGNGLQGQTLIGDCDAVFKIMNDVHRFMTINGGTANINGITVRDLQICFECTDDNGTTFVGFRIFGVIGMAIGGMQFIAVSSGSHLAVHKVPLGLFVRDVVVDKTGELIFLVDKKFDGKPKRALVIYEPIFAPAAEPADAKAN